MNITKAPLCFVILLGIFSANLTGCSFKELKKDLDEIDTFATITGQVKSETSETNAAIIAVLVEESDLQFRIIDTNILKSLGTYTFLAPEGEYRIYVFEDLNEDLKLQLGERLGRTDVIKYPGAGKTVMVDVVLPEKNSAELKEEIKNIKSKAVDEFFYSNVLPGTKIDLMAEIFSDDNISKGLWQPLQFVKNIPFGLFFLDDYDESKIPVIFVHGVSGSPKQFRALIDNLDQSKYQPWVFYYPSGFQISTIGRFLKEEVDKVHTYFDFKELQIVAHSMGGLVSRSFINEYKGEFVDFSVKDFITISTPWAGHEAANAGLKYAPVIIPVWEDIAPGSEFISNILEVPLPKETQHYLLFGFEGESSYTDGNSDGVVSIASELRLDVQENAAIIRGFAEDHTSILENDDMLKLVNTILE